MNDLKSFASIVLAAGKGTRMNAGTTNKVLLKIQQKPMIGYTIDLLEDLSISPIVVVIGHYRSMVKKYLRNRVSYAIQTKLLGTGHAVIEALPAIPKSKQHVIVFYGDHSAFYKSWMIEVMINKHLKTKAVTTFVTVNKKNPTGYGRILRDRSGKILGIREQKNATKQNLKVKEINAGCYCFTVSFLREYLSKIKKNPVKHEYYLTDLVELALKDNLKVETLEIQDEVIAVGVNTPGELHEADMIMKSYLKQ